MNVPAVASDKDIAFLLDNLALFSDFINPKVEYEDFVRQMFHSFFLFNLPILNRVPQLGKDGGAGLFSSTSIFVRNFPDGNVAVVVATHQEFLVLPPAGMYAGDSVLVFLRIMTLQKH